MAVKLDYRDILKNEFEKRFTANPLYSLRAYARDLGVSPSRLSEIFARKNGLSTTNAVRISELLRLDESTREWFRHSVSAQHSRNPAQRKISQAELEKNRAAISTRILNHEEFRVIANWYHFAILELLVLKNFTLSAKNVSAQLGISVDEADLAIERLKKLGWMKKVGERWITKEEYRTVSSPTPSQAIRSFHTQILNKAETAIEEQGISERIVHTLILSTRADKMTQANAELEKFCAEFNRKFSAEVDSGEKLYALSLQFFRLNQTANSKKVLGEI